MTMHGPRGTLTQEAGVNVITFQRSYAAAPERVWDALTTVDGITSWLAPDAAIDAVQGGIVRLRFDDDNEVTGTITLWDPYTDFEHEWIINGSVMSHVRYTLAAVAGGTELTLTHRGLPDEMSGGYTPGWHAYCARLDASIGGTEMPDWLDVFQSVAEIYN
ncbi:MAG: SRPBCC domain-containing protein [Acidimicrobiia bacterium]